MTDTTLAGAGPAVKGRKPVCLILEPSRELAEQTHEAIASFRKYVHVVFHAGDVDGVQASSAASHSAIAYHGWC